jgi:hypothetical protein
MCVYAAAYGAWGIYLISDKVREEFVACRALLERNYLASRNYLIT